MAGQDAGFALGVDLGTSNTVAVLRWPDGRTRPLLFDGQPVMPSGVFADADGRLHVGRDAQRLAQADPARYEPNPKRRIDEPGVLLGDRDLPTADLLAAVLRTVAQAAVEAAGFLPPAVVTYPAAWGARRRQVLADAAARAGWPPAVAPTAPGAPGEVGSRPGSGTLLVPEPVAAARYFTEVLRRPVPVGSALAVFDFGGGTLDIAVVRNEGTDPTGRAVFAVTGSGGLAELGGLDLDAALVDHLGELISRTDPQAWQRLNQPETASQWRDRRQFWDDVRGAKEMLSRTTVAPLAVPGVEQAVHLTREELERLAAPLLRRGVFEAAAVLSRSQVAPDQLAGLFLVGGSSRVPMVARLLHSELGIAPTVLEQPELPVAEGALAELPPPATAVRATATVSVPHPAPVPVSVPHPSPVPVSVPHPSPVSVSGGPSAPYGVPPGPPGPPVPPGYRPGQPAVPTGMPPYGPPAGPMPYQGYPGGTPYPMGQLGPAPGRRRRAVWIWTGVAAALVGVLAVAGFYLLRDPYRGVEFQTFVDVGRVAAGGERPSNFYTSVAGDRAYLAYRQEDKRLTVIGADAGTARELWRVQTDPATDWVGIVALPTAVIALAEEYGDSTPRKLYALDPANGRTRWSRDILGNDEIHLYRDTLVLLDRTGAQLLGLDLASGRPRWTLANVKDEYDSKITAVYRVSTADGLDGPETVAEDMPRPPAGDDQRLVQVGADRSIRVIDVGNGKVLRSRPNVADPRDLVYAYEGRVYVAGADGGYRLAAYDLDTLGEPANLYTAAGKDHRSEALISCGEERMCLLESRNFDRDTTELVMVDAKSGGAKWRRPVAKMDGLRSVGEHVLVRSSFSPSRTIVFNRDGGTVTTQDGVGVRINGGSVLIFSDSLSTSQENPSVAGVRVDSGDVTQLGQLKVVRPASCSWNEAVIACGSADDFVIRRFAR